MIRITCVFLEDAQTLVQRNHFDILYLDPPYNDRSYAHYYHLPETIALEKTPRVTGMSGIPKYITATSDFNRPQKACNALRDLLKEASFQLLIYHYADNGIIPQHEIQSILSQYGKPEEVYITGKGYSTRKMAKQFEHHIYFVKNE